MKMRLAATLAGAIAAAASAPGPQQGPWPGPTPPDVLEARLKERRVRRPTPEELKKIEGAFHGGHFGGPQVIRPEEPDHPLNACFAGKSLEISDESYVPGPPYSRQKLRVLLSLDLTRTPDPAEKAAWLKEVVKGREGDYPISWIKPYGRGRVFYCSLGHSPTTYLNPMFLRHVLAGIQFVLGDLPADARPRAVTK